MIHMQLVGDKALLARLRKAAVVAPVLTGGALRAEAARVLETARGLAPIETGALRASGRLNDGGINIGPRGGGINVSIEFTAPYALIQHERMDYNHPNGGQAKFLEIAVMQAADGLEKRMSRDLHGVFSL